MTSTPPLTRRTAAALALALALPTAALAHHGDPLVLGGVAQVLVAHGAGLPGTADVHPGQGVGRAY